MKQCGRCKEMKSLTEFSKNRSRVDGLQYSCKPCHRASVLAAQKAHPERVNNYIREWNLRNPEKVQEYRRRTVDKRRTPLAKALRRDARLNPEESDASKRAKQWGRVRRWKLANPERRRELARRGAMRRYAAKQGAAGYCTVDQAQARWDFYGGLCWMCGNEATQYDHVVALAKGGSEWPANLRPACGSCNRMKWDRDWREMVA